MDGYGFQAHPQSHRTHRACAWGLRIDIGFAGTLTEGPMTGAVIEGIDYLLIRPDGVAVIDARELVTGTDGITTSVSAGGYIVPPFEMPGLSMLLDPPFCWPDVDLPLHGSARMQSAAPALPVVNRSVYAFTGAVNMARGSLVVTARRIGADASQPYAEFLGRH
jgi:hypothetical protein